MRQLFRVRLLLSVAFLFFCLSAKTQTYNAFVKAGEVAFAQQEFFEAYNHFQMAMQIDSTDAALWGNVAKAAAAFKLFETADFYFKKIETAGKTKEIRDFSTAWFAVKMTLGDYNAAADLTKRYGLQPQKKVLQTALDLKNKPVSVRIERLNDDINTPYSDFAAQKVGDDLIYTAYRFKEENAKNEKFYTAKLIRAAADGTVAPLKDRFNSDEGSSANTFFWGDSAVFYTVCTRVQQQQRCAIFFRKKVKNTWSKPEKLPPHINAEGYTTTQPCVGFDSTSRQFFLYFVSDKTGKMNLWRSALTADGYAKPDALSFLDHSTATQNLTPFFEEKTQTLYFSSDRKGGMGGLDIYKVRRTRSGWTKVENIGFPINTGYDEAYLWREGDNGYFSSNRKGSLTLLKKGACCYDIYALQWLPNTPETPENSSETPPETPPLAQRETPENPQNTPPTSSNPPSNPPSSSPETPKTPTLPREVLQDFLPLSLYFHNDEPDPKTRLKTTKMSYDQIFRSYYGRKKEYAQALKSAAHAAEVETFFEEKVYQNFEELQRFSDLLLGYLQRGERFQIVLKGFASPRAKTDYNLNLSKRRVSSVENFFRTYKNGVFLPFFENGQLVISTAAFGESAAVSTVSDDLTDEKKSIYSIEAAKERRVEILKVQ